MIPEGHAAATTNTSSAAQEKPTSTWCPSAQPLCDGSIEAWLLDQLALSTLPLDMKLCRYEEVARLFRHLRSAHSEGQAVHDMCDTSTPSEMGEWRWFEVNGTFQIWRMGRGGFVIEFRPGPDGEMRWRAGHDFGTSASCSAWVAKRKGREPGSCGSEAAVLAPVCLTHAGKEFTSNLARQGLVRQQATDSDEH